MEEEEEGGRPAREVSWEEREAEEGSLARAANRREEARIRK